MGAEQEEDTGQADRDSGMLSAPTTWRNPALLCWLDAEVTCSARPSLPPALPGLPWSHHCSVYAGLSQRGSRCPRGAKIPLIHLWVLGANHTQAPSLQSTFVNEQMNERMGCNPPGQVSGWDNQGDGNSPVAKEAGKAVHLRIISFPSVPAQKCALWNKRNTPA